MFPYGINCFSLLTPRGFTFLPLLWFLFFSDRSHPPSRLLTSFCSPTEGNVLERPQMNLAKPPPLISLYSLVSVFRVLSSANSLRDTFLLLEFCSGCHLNSHLRWSSPSLFIPRVFMLENHQDQFPMANFPQ